MLIPYAKMNGFRYSLKEIIRIMKRNNTVAGLLLSPPVSNWRPCPNEEIISLARKSEGLLFPVLTLENKSDSIETALKIAKSNTVKGFKILLGYQQVYPNDQLFSKLYDYCEEKEIPVLFHTGDTASRNGSLTHSHPLNLDALANTRPELRIVACHFGNPWIMDTAEIVYKHEHIYADISGLFAGKDSVYSSKYFDYMVDSISKAIHYIGSCERILFGSDYPISPPDGVLKLAMRLDISAKDRKKILYENAKELFML
jgi:predicted TIM-barrel fold metal-dependent hydrolase